MWIRRVTVMNTGIGDAVNVGWKLAHMLQDRADPSLLDTYESERIGLCAFPRGDHRSRVYRCDPERRRWRRRSATMRNCQGIWSRRPDLNG